MTCPKSNKIIAKKYRKNAIYIDGRWIARCPKCEGVAPFKSAEVRPDNAGYVYRYLEH